MRLINLKSIWRSIGHLKELLRSKYLKLEAGNSTFINSINQFVVREEVRLSLTIKCGRRSLISLGYPQPVHLPVLPSKIIIKNIYLVMNNDSILGRTTILIYQS